MSAPEAVSGDKPIATAREETVERADSEALRYREYYGIDIDELEIYDLALNTARFSPGAVLDVVIAAVESYDADADEGKTPVDVDYEF